MRGHTQRVSREESAVLRDEIRAFVQGTGQVSPLRGLLPTVYIVSGYPDQVSLKTAVFDMRRILVDPWGPK